MIIVWLLKILQMLCYHILIVKWFLYVMLKNIEILFQPLVCPLVKFTSKHEALPVGLKEIRSYPVEQWQLLRSEPPRGIVTFLGRYTSGYGVWCVVDSMQKYKSGLRMYAWKEVCLKRTSLYCMSSNPATLEGGVKSWREQRQGESHSQCCSWMYIQQVKEIVVGRSLKPCQPSQLCTPGQLLHDMY